MGIISKYFSLFSYSIHHPKKGLSLFNELKQSNEYSNQVIKKHSAKSLTLEKCLDIVSQENSFSRKQLIENTSKLEEHFRSYFDKMKNEDFPSKKKPYPTDYSINSDSRLFLYGLCKLVRPDVIIETGVAYGLSSSYILQALHENNNGVLYSIDDVFRPWESIEMIGDAIPKNLRDRWKLVVGSSLIKLKETIQSLDKIDIFLHDSLHTYKNMLFEFNTSWSSIKKNGFLISDDVSENNAFLDFYSSKNKSTVLLADRKNNHVILGLIRKD